MALTDPIIGSELNDEFDIGTIVANKVSIKIDGTTVTKNASNQITATPGSLTYDNATAVITYTNAAGNVQNIDLSALTTDIYVDGGTFDAATSVLTLTDNNGGTADVTIDLSSLLGVSTDAGNLLNNGADGKPLFTKTDLDAQTSILTSLFGTQLGRLVNI
jgi:hypothetical protein